MELKVSRPIQILVGILVLAGVGGVLSLQMLGKSSAPAATPSAAQVLARAHARAGITTNTATTPAHHAAKPVRHAAATTTPPVVSVPKTATAPRPKPATTTAANGLPLILVDALRQHRVVVVSIFDPQDRTDAISFAEARAGASDAGAGFLGVSVLDDSVAGPLTAALPGGGLLPVPGVLVYRRPGTLVERFDGFADRDAIAQMSVSGLTDPPLASTLTSTTATTTTPAAVAPVAAAPTDTTTTP